MMKKLLTLLTLILTVNYASSQDGLPRLIAYEGDTLILIGTDQIVIANIVNAELSKQYELNDSLRSDLQKHKTTIIRMEDALVAVQSAGRLKDRQIATNQEIITELRQLFEKAERKRKRAVVLNQILVPVTATLGVIVAILI